MLAGVIPSAKEMLPLATVGKLATMTRLRLAHNSPLMVPVHMQGRLVGVRDVSVLGPGQSLQRTWAGVWSGAWPCEALQAAKLSSC